MGKWKQKGHRIVHKRNEGWVFNPNLRIYRKGNKESMRHRYGYKNKQAKMRVTQELKWIFWGHDQGNSVTFPEASLVHCHLPPVRWWGDTWMGKWQKIEDKRHIGCLVRDTEVWRWDTGRHIPNQSNEDSGFLGQMGKLVPWKKAQKLKRNAVLGRNQISVTMKR